MENDWIGDDSGVRPAGSMMRLSLAVLALCLANTSSVAANLDPGPVELARAAREGTALAIRREGYPLKGYVLYEVPDAQAIDPASGAVDAIALGTPFERARHEAYLTAYEGRPAAAALPADLPSGHVAIIVFGRAANDEDKSFKDRFGKAALTFDTGEHLEAAAEPSDTDEAVYPRAQAPRKRLTATITYRFDLRSIRDPGARSARLAFIDSTGKPFDLPLDLRRYR